MIVAEFSAVLDTNTLMPASLRDTMLRAAERHLFDPLWSPQILDELGRNLLRQQLATPQSMRRLLNALDSTFPHASRQGYEHLIPSMVVDPKDRHVAALAVHAGASMIVTFNLSDFPAGALAAHDVAVVHPDELLLRLYARRPALMHRLIDEQARALTRPSHRVEDILRRLNRHVPRFVAALDADG